MAENGGAVQVVGRGGGQQPAGKQGGEYPGRNGGVGHVFNVFEQIDADNGGGNAGGVRQGRHFVAEKRTGNDCARRHRQIGVEGFAHADKGHADGGAGGQAAADADADQRAEDEGGKIEIFG